MSSCPFLSSVGAGHLAFSKLTFFICKMGGCTLGNLCVANLCVALGGSGGDFLEVTGAADHGLISPLCVSLCHEGSH